MTYTDEERKQRMRESQKRWRARNRDKVKALNVKWINNNKDRYHEIHRKAQHAYYIRHPNASREAKERGKERIRAYQKIYDREYRNKELARFYHRMRGYRLRGADGSHSLSEWQDLKKFYNYMCLCCKQQEPFIKLTEDHIVPLSRGGSNDISNIQPLCVSCNSIKSTKTTNFMPQSREPTIEALTQ